MSSTQVFYKYTDLNPLPDQIPDQKIKLDTYLENKLYFSPPSKLNDPSDAVLRYELKDMKQLKEKLSKKYTLRKDLEEDELLDIILPNINGYKHNIIAAHRPKGSSAYACSLLANSIGLFCLSEKCDNFLMWSHYADSHRGICIGFEFEEEPTAVTYSSRRPSKINYLNSIKKYSKNYFSEKLKQQLLTKSICWSYEDEKRIILDKTGSRPHPFKIKEIIFGLNVSTEKKFEIVTKVYRYNNEVILRECVGVDDTYKIIIKRSILLDLYVKGPP